MLRPPRAFVAALTLAIALAKWHVYRKLLASLVSVSWAISPGA